jgi:hypothetical protein
MECFSHVVSCPGVGIARHRHARSGRWPALRRWAISVLEFVLRIIVWSGQAQAAARSANNKHVRMGETCPLLHLGWPRAHA